MADEEDVVVEIEGDESAATTQKVDVEAAKPAGKDPLEEIRAQHEEQQAALRKRAEEAERRASQERQEAERARQEAERARSDVAESQLDTVSTGLAAAQAAAEAAEAEFIRAQEAGDWKAAAKAQRAIAAAESKIGRLEEAKADLEARKVSGGDEARKPQQTTQADPVEQFISTRTEPTANWLRAHRDYLTDSRKNAKLTAAHHDAVAEGHTPDTPDYFSHVETFLGLGAKEPAKANGSNGATTQAKRKATVPVAPVSNTGGAVNGGGEIVKLTPGEAAAATDGITHVWAMNDLAAGRIKDKGLIGKPIGIQEMARRKLAMQKEGRYASNYYES